MNINRLFIPSLCAVVLAGSDGSQAQNTSRVSAPAQTASAASINPAPPSPTVAVGATNPAATTPEGAVPAPAPALKAPPELPGPVQEVVRLAQTTLGENVLVSYINNITEPYRLTADDIIYLNDLGISGPVVSALLTREGVLRSANVAPATAVPNATTAANFASSAAAPASTSPPGAGVPPSGAGTPPPAGVNPGQSGAISYADVPGGAPAQPPVVYGQPQPGSPTAAPQTIAAPASGATVINYNTFYDSLSPYGSWVEVADYGYCWRPSVAIVDSGWHPYSHNGSWVWSDYGWYWNSGYSWGWAPFHYGRWHRSAHLGWVWQPGCDWGPAWVNWSYTGEHCAWAPLPPECHWRSGVGFSWWNGRTSVSVGFGLSANCWIGVGWSDFCRPRIWEHRVPQARVTEVVTHGRNSVVGDKNQVVNINGNNNTVIINNGAPYDKVKGATRDEIKKVAIADVRPGGGVVRQPGTAANQPVIAAYRPHLDNAAAQPKTPSPAVLNRQGEEQRKTAEAPGNAASRPNAGPLPGAASGFTATAPGRAGGGAAPVSANSGIVAPSRNAGVPATTAPSARSEASGNRPLTTPGSLTPSQAPARPTAAATLPTPTALPSASARTTDVLQDNRRIQNPSLAPRVEERKVTPQYQTPQAPTSPYASAPGAIARPNSAYAVPSVQNPVSTAPGQSGTSLRPNYTGPAPSARPSYDNSVNHAAPSYTAPSFSSPNRANAPAPSYSAPSYTVPSRANAPAPVYSAPPANRNAAPAPSRPSSEGNGKNGRE